MFSSHGGALSETRITFSGTITPTKISAAYRAGMMVTAVTMLLLPLLYVGLIAATGAAVWWHVTGNTWILDSDSGPRQLRFLLYISPAVAGVVLTFFMVKPILARSARRRDPLTIDPATQPLLFSTIDEICRQVGAPRPQRVDVNCTVNASAGLVHPMNPFRNELVLTIGLPLAAGLTARQLAGVLAHEFGHFAQGGGMRVTAIVRGVNAWFSRVVYARDAWDEKLERWSKESNWQIGIVLAVARGAVWISRWILTGLMYGGHTISCFMMRQMEYDADSYEVKVAGTTAFVQTATRLRELDAAARYAYGDVRDGLHRGVLPHDFSAFIAERCRHIPDDMLAEVREVGTAKTGRFDTHPSDADRIRAATDLNASGVIADGEVPARTLFRDFEALSAAATRHHFEHDLGVDVQGATFVGTEVAISESKSREADLSAIPGVFGECCTMWRPIHVPTYELASLDEHELLAHMAAAAATMTARAAEMASKYETFNEFEERRNSAYAAQELFRSGFTTVNHQEFGLPAPTLAAATAQDEGASAQQRTLGASLDDFDAAAGRRLACGVLLSSRSGDGGDEETSALVAALNALVRVMPELRELQRCTWAAMTVGHNAADSPQPEQAASRCRSLDEAIQQRCRQLREALADTPCPSFLTATPMTLAERCGLHAGESIDSSDVGHRTHRVYFDLLGRACALTLQVEASLVPTL